MSTKEHSERQRRWEISYKDTTTAQVRSNGRPGQDGGIRDGEKQKDSRNIKDRKSKDLMTDGV